MWRFASLASVAVVATGLLPWDETSDVTWRMAPILLFLVAITVLAELAEVAMVFDIAAREAAHLARGRTPVLVLLVAGLATLTTILLGLDTTAVLLTPVVLALALVVAAALRHGGDHLVASITGTGSGAGALLHVAGVGAVTSNLLNNLPAYLVVEPIAAGGGPSRLLALLVGTNVGPLVLLWGSLATLLWRHRCRARGVEVSAQEFAVMGLLGVPVVLVASTFAFVADVALGVINEQLTLAGAPGVAAARGG